MAWACNVTVYGKLFSLFSFFFSIFKKELGLWSNREIGHHSSPAHAFSETQSVTVCNCRLIVLWIGCLQIYSVSCFPLKYGTKVDTIFPANVFFELRLKCDPTDISK